MLRRFRRNACFDVVFSLANELLLKRLPVRNPGNLYLLERESPDYLRPNSFFTERCRREVVLKNPLVSAAVFTALRQE